MKAKRFARAVSVALAVLMTAGSTLTVMADGDAVLLTAAKTGGTLSGGERTESIEEVREILESLNYVDYIAELGDVKAATKTVEVKAADAYDSENSTDASAEVLGSYEGASGKVLSTSDAGTVSMKIDIPEDGLYAVRFRYYPANGKSTSIDRTFRIDGKIPFAEARALSFTKVWVDNYTEFNEDGTQKLTDLGTPAFKRDTNDNDIRPSKTEAPEWREVWFSDSTGFYQYPLQFYFTKGEHTITLEAVREPVIIDTLTFTPYEELQSYADYEKATAGKTDGASSAGKDAEVMIQAENPSKTSDQIIYQIYDRTSAITMPQDPSKIRLNTIGRDKWQNVGQWIEYDFDVAESGYYNISMRFLQNTLQGCFVSRKMLIDGELPFEDARSIRFNYADTWQIKSIGTDDGTPFKIYLEKGHHTVSFEVVLGDLSEMLYNVTESNRSLNTMYLQILMLTGADPDFYVDYNFEGVIPDVVRGLRNECDNLYGYSASLEEIIGEKGSHTVTLDKIAYLCKKMGYDTSLIARNLTTLKSYIGTLGTWLLTTRNQPLEVDYILVSPAGEKLPAANANVFQAIGFEFQAFVMSFFTDYTSIGMTADSGEKTQNIEVWYQVDRDRATIIRQMIDDQFTPYNDVGVTFKLVAGGTLLPSILAGVGPDVVLGIGSGDVINYAIRSALHPLNEFDTFDDVITRFSSSALTPLTLYGSTYAIPETQSFSMLYYRSDVLLQLGLEIPKTWDDFYNMLPAILAQNMQIGFPAGLNSTLTFMYQQDEPLYKTYQVLDASGDMKEISGMAINLDSNKSLYSFKKMIDLITQYSLPLTYDFANRFRTGEMPVGVADISLYNQLMVFAPEIDGLWGFVALPGTVDEETGELNYSSPSGVAGTVMINSKDENNDYTGAWKFIDWWTSAEAQSRFGQETVALMGEGAKYFTANLESLEALPWDSSDYNNIAYQFNQAAATPEMPGGYIINRYIEFAYRAVYNEDKEPVEEIYNYVDEINAELTRKRAEFELALIDDFDERDDGVLVPKEEGMYLADDGRLYTKTEYDAYLNSK